MLSDTRDDDRFSFRQFIKGFDHILGLRGLSGTGRGVFERIFFLPFGDFTEPFRIAAFDRVFIELPKNVFDVDQYGNSAKEKDIDGSVALYQMTLSE